jgi:hypothetical protein
MTLYVTPPDAEVGPPADHIDNAPHDLIVCAPDAKEGPADLIVCVCPWCSDRPQLVQVSGSL